MYTHTHVHTYVHIHVHICVYITVYIIHLSSLTLNCLPFVNQRACHCAGVRHLHLKSVMRGQEGGSASVLLLAFFLRFMCLCVRVNT